jgi:hypothetical protein
MRRFDWWVGALLVVAALVSDTLAEACCVSLRVVGSIPTRLTSSNPLTPNDRNLDPK